MAVFAFYHYDIDTISKSGEFDFPVENDEQKITKENIFENLFVEEKSVDLKVIRKKKDGSVDERSTADVYNNEVVANYDDILIMTLENNKVKHTTVDKMDIVHDHHPYAYIIIDYRKGHNLIAIEKSSAFDNKPDKVCEIIISAFDRLFFRYNYRITLTAYKKEYIDLWEAVTNIRRKLKDRVQKISLGFKNKEANSDVSTSQVADVLAAISKRAQAKGLWSLEAQEGDEINIDAIHEDLINIADICLEQGEYDLTVNFQNYGLYRYGTEVYAMYGLDMLLIDSYRLKVEDSDLWGERHGLKNWLDQMLAMCKEHIEDDTFISGPTKQGDRR